MQQENEKPRSTFEADPAQFAEELVQIGQLVEIPDGLGTVFAEWLPARYTLPAGTALYAIPPAAPGQGETGGERAALVAEDDPIVGHKTFHDGIGFRHEPLRKTEADALWKSVEASKAELEAAMPDEQAAIRAMFNGWLRLQDFGWREAIYCPKDGSPFYVLEPGSTGIHTAHYSGEWPSGSWFVEADNDLWPSRPVLFKEIPK